MRKIQAVQSLILTLLLVSGAEASNLGHPQASKRENQPPVADAGKDNLAKEGTRVVLNGSASLDPDGDSLIFQWKQTGGKPVQLNGANSPTPYFTAPKVDPGGGTLTFALVVTETGKKKPKSSAPDTVTVTVSHALDSPRCDFAAPSIDTLWPADDKMKKVSIENIVDDANDPYHIVTIDIIKVTQDEPTHGESAGNNAPDAVIHVADPFDYVSLRAERSDNGDGRVYVIQFEASDGFEACTGSVSVGVPLGLDPKSGPPVDSGQEVDATVP